MQEQQNYVVLCKFDGKKPSSTAYQECQTLEDVYKFITKLGIQLFKRRNPEASPDRIQFSKLIDSLKSIPFLKVYEHDPSNRMNYLRGSVNFGRGYKAYMARISDEATKVYQELNLAETKQECLKSEIQRAVHKIKNKKENI